VTRKGGEGSPTTVTLLSDNSGSDNVIVVGAPRVGEVGYECVLAPGSQRRPAKDWQGF
jgi:hypothetical protein